MFFFFVRVCFHFEGTGGFKSSLVISSFVLCGFRFKARPIVDCETQYECFMMASMIRFLAVSWAVVVFGLRQMEEDQRSQATW